MGSDHIRIGLTNLAHKVLESDRIIFGASANSNLTFTGIVNDIINNFDDDFLLDASLLTVKTEFHKPMRLRNETVESLDLVQLSDKQKGVKNLSAPKYVRCLLESYTRRPFIEREKLLKKDVIQEIESAVYRKKKLRVTYIGEQREITPISIEPAKEGTFQYLIGEEGGSLVSLRLSRIEKIKAAGKSNPICQSKERIKADLAEYGPTFITEPRVKIQVKFSENGLKSYPYTVIHRPMHIDIQENNVYTFDCSEKQALYFFFRFAGDVEILEPQSLRDKMRDLYLAGLKNYE